LQISQGEDYAKIRLYKRMATVEGKEKGREREKKKGKANK